MASVALVDRRAFGFCAILCFVAASCGPVKSVKLPAAGDEASVRNPAPLPAFPGAGGFGTSTPGGRAGKVLAVTSLEDYDPESEDPLPGTLRRAVDQPGPRIVVFQVSGIIHLETPLVIGDLRDPDSAEAHSWLTLAGQSAPGGGVTIADQPVIIGGGVHDVVIRHLRFRNSPVDGISFTNGSRRVILDHCSISWATDENIGFYGDNQEITIQNCIVAECLRNGGHHKGPHSMGFLISRGANRVSLHHNFITGNDARNPQFVGNNSLLRDRQRFGTRFPVFDMRNNFIYNCRSWTRLNHGAQVDIVRNLYVAGPDGGQGPAFYFFNDQDRTRAYLEDNQFSWNEPVEDQWSMVAVGRAYLTPEQLERTKQDVSRCRAADPFPAPPVTESPVEDLPGLVVPAGGALPHDAVDQRLISEYFHGAGQCGAPDRTHDSRIPGPSIGEPLSDADLDGMPDGWEIRHSLDLHDPRDAAADPDGDGYTNLETYLNQLSDVLVEQALRQHTSMR